MGQLECGIYRAIWLFETRNWIIKFGRSFWELWSTFERLRHKMFWKKFERAHRCWNLAHRVRLARVARVLLFKNAETRTDLTFTCYLYSKILQKANWRSFHVKNSIKPVKDSFTTSNNSANQKITPIKDDPIPHRHLIISSLFKNQLKANLIISRIKFKPVASNKIKKQFIRHKQKTSWQKRC